MYSTVPSLVCVLSQVLEQVSAKADDVLCQRATLFPDKNRSTSYLPRMLLMLAYTNCAGTALCICIPQLITDELCCRAVLTISMLLLPM